MEKKKISDKIKLLFVIFLVSAFCIASSDQDVLTAIKEGNLEQVKSLLEKQPDLVKMDLGDGATLLHLAAHYGQKKIAAVLIKKGINPNGTDTYGRTALHYAFGNKNLDFSKMLIDNGANIDCQNVWGRTLAYGAARSGYIEGIRFLIRQGSDINKQDEYGKSPLHAAVDTKQAEVIELLLKNSARINAGDKWNQTPLFTAVSNREPGMVILLTNNGADIHHQNGWKQTPLHRAVISGYPDIAEGLIKRGGQVNGRDVHNMTPLDYAGRFGHHKLAELLKKRGAKGSSPVSNFSFFPFNKMKLENGEAIIWYLGHSGWALKTKNHLLIFDYYENTPPPAEPKMINGRINPDEIKDLKVFVFSSHEHRDHFDKTVLQWKETIGDIHYVFGWKAFEDPAHTYMGFRKKTDLEKLSIESVHSTGAGELEGNFLVKVDGLTLYHSGDYSRGHELFKKDMDHLAQITSDIDLFFMLAGNDMDNSEALVALEKVKPRNMFPMHAGGSEYAYMEFAELAGKRGIKTKIICSRNRGDMFMYRDTKILPVNSYDEIINK